MGYRGMTVGATPLLPYHMEGPSFTLERSAAGGGETSPHDPRGAVRDGAPRGWCSSASSSTASMPTSWSRCTGGPAGARRPRRRPIPPGGPWSPCSCRSTTSATWPGASSTRRGRSTTPLIGWRSRCSTTRRTTPRPSWPRRPPASARGGSPSSTSAAPSAPASRRGPSPPAWPPPPASSSRSSTPTSCRLPGGMTGNGRYVDYPHAGAPIGRPPVDHRSTATTA